ncbi:neprilysin-1-like [Ischnura elegans]|uniref:neprilysin-1-like n=1 Tax=Ischnura elegans TaxID=197161 RepID=UPI001ED8899D|nr:neprilysin-1-like [Ischnura elegans]
MTQPSDSHPDLVEVSSRSTYLKRATTPSHKSNLQRRLVAVIILLAILAAALVIAVGILSYNSNKMSDTVLEPQVCTSNQCVETAANLMKSLDLDADPCEDFYQFTCGNWAANHPIPDFTASTDWFFERKLHLAQRIRKVLEQDPLADQPIPVTQAQMLFQSCLNTTAIDTSGIEPVLQILDHAGLPRKLPMDASTVFNASYSFPTMSSEGLLIYQKPKKSSLSAELRWLVPLVGCKRVLGKDPLIGFGVLPHPLNRTANVLSVASPSMRSPLPENEVTNGGRRRRWRMEWQEQPLWSRGRYNTRLRDHHSSWKWRKSSEDEEKGKEDASTNYRALYMESMVKLLELWDALKNVTLDPAVVIDYISMYRSGSSGGKSGALKDHVQQIDALQGAVYKLFMDSLQEDINIMSEFSSGEDRRPPFDEIHVNDLQRLTDEAAYSANPNPNLRIEWRIYFNLMFENSNVTLDFDTDLIVVQNINYLKNVAKLLANTSPMVLEGLLWWEVMYIAAPHGNSLMRHLYNSYVEKITGGEIPRSRVMDCSRVTNDMMGMAVSWLLASEELAMNDTSLYDDDEEFTNVIEEKTFRVKGMLADIKSAFADLVLQLDWMDEETKEATLNKADTMRNYISYPSWLMEPNELEIYYEGVSINITSYLQNLANVLQVGELWSLRGLRTENNFEAWATDPTDVNAFHTFQENAVTIPAGILQFPFFGLGLDVMDYGAIGSVLGHELTHGFDNSGRHFDESGNWRQWWTNITIAEYKNRTACFASQYSSYSLPGINTKVDGKQTLGENIADNGGIREAVAAFKKHKQRTSDLVDIRLPGLEQFSEDHLLFIAFGSLWCEHGTDATVRWTIERDEHSPSRARVWGAVSNSEEFARAFNCTKGSPMNPEVKCRIW